MSTGGLRSARKSTHQSFILLAFSGFILIAGWNALPNLQGLQKTVKSVQSQARSTKELCDGLVRKVLADATQWEHRQCNGYIGMHLVDQESGLFWNNSDRDLWVTRGNIRLAVLHGQTIPLPFNDGEHAELIFWEPLNESK